MTTAPKITITDAMSNAKLFGPHFNGSSWDRWRTVNKAAFAEPMTATEQTLFREIADRDPPAHRVKELICCVGRGGGKDSDIAFLASYAAMSFNPRTARLRPGEQIYIVCIACDRDQANIAFGMIHGLFENIPTLKALLKSVDLRNSTIKLKNRIVIQVSTNSYRTVRGRGILFAVLDEAAFFRSDTGTVNGSAANPAEEVVAALAPGLARVPNSMMVMISSAYTRSGVFYDRWKSAFGKPDDNTLVIKATTTQMNPTFPQATIDRALEQDRLRYNAEYNSIWRDDLQTLVAREVVEDCVVPGCHEIAPQSGVSYVGFIDSASGSGQDSFGLAIGHLKAEMVVIDCLREIKPPFSPEIVSKEFCDLLLSYHISFCLADKYAGEWLSEQFSKNGVRVDQSAKSKSELYTDMLAMLSSRRVALLDHPRSVAQICSLERRNRSGGRASIDSPVGMHEDVANCIAGIISSSFFKYNINSMSDSDDEDDSILAARRLRQAKAQSHWPTEYDANGNPMVNYSLCSR
jgi:hypothetical protein